MKGRAPHFHSKLIYLIIAGDFSLNPKITSWVYSENNQPVQTTQRDNDNQAGNVKPDRPSKKEQEIASSSQPYKSNNYAWVI